MSTVAKRILANVLQNYIKRCQAYKTRSSGLWHEVILPTVFPRVAQCEGRGVTEYAEGVARLWIHPTRGKCQSESKFETQTSLIQTFAAAP